METTKKELPAFVYKSWEEVDKALKILGKMRKSHKAKTDSLAKEVSDLQEKQMPGIKKLLADMQPIEESIAYFAKENNKTGTEGMLLKNGDVYYTDNPPSLAIQENITEENVIKKIKKFFSDKYSSYVRVKTEIAKAVIKKEFTDEKITKKDLNKMGLEMVQTEKLNIETK